MKRQKKNPVGQYFADIWAGISSTYVGMRLTLRYCFRPKVTMQYPEVKPVIPDTHRGLHGYHEETCNGCGMCLRACPVDCIAIEKAGRGKNVMITRFDIDYTKCIFCELCTDSCATDSLTMTEAYDLSSFSRGDCVLHLAMAKSAGQIEEFELEMKKKDDERKAKAAAAKAKKEAEAKEAEAKKDD